MTIEERVRFAAGSEDAVRVIRSIAAQARAEAIEECAKVAMECGISGPLTPGWPDGAASASRQIAAAIRSLDNQLKG